MFFDDIIPIALIILSFLFLPFVILPSFRPRKPSPMTHRGATLLLCVLLGALFFFESSFQWPRFTLRPPSYFVVSPS
jgi:hypothetical protein